MVGILQFCIISLWAVTVTECGLGVDFSTLQPLSYFQCLKDAGYTFVVPRAYHSYGQFDLNVVPNLNNARSAGLKTDIYMFACRGKSPITQVDDLIQKVSQNLYDVIWVDVEINPSAGCSWSANDLASNCEFLQQTINRIIFHKRKVGIYSTKYFWKKIFGDQLACPQVSSSLLWYANYDKLSVFSDFIPFGGWTTPFMKQYVGDTQICGVNSDKNYRP